MIDRNMYPIVFLGYPLSENVLPFLGYQLFEIYIPTPDIKKLNYCLMMDDLACRLSNLKRFDVNLTTRLQTGQFI